MVCNRVKYRVWGMEYRIGGIGCSVWGLRVWDWRYRVQGMG
jgi:hypothetical protein